MHRCNFLISVLPVALGSGAIIGFLGLLTLLFFPETVMRSALSAMVSEPPRPLRTAWQDSFTDEILDGSGVILNANGIFQPIGLNGSFAVGDRLSVQHGENGFRSFVVTDVSRIGDLTTKVTRKNRYRRWVLVIAEDVAHPGGPKYRFIVEESDPLPLQLKNVNSQAL